MLPDDDDDDDDDDNDDNDGICLQIYTYSTYTCIFIDIEISSKKILFQDVIRKGVKTQIPFTGYPFVILGTKHLDCTHGVDRNSSKKKKYLESKL